jgi:hypothetical protein
MQESSENSPTHPTHLSFDFGSIDQSTSLMMNSVSICSYLSLKLNTIVVLRLSLSLGVHENTTGSGQWHQQRIQAIVQQVQYIGGNRPAPNQTGKMVQDGW